MTLSLLSSATTTLDFCFRCVFLFYFSFSRSLDTYLFSKLTGMLTQSRRLTMLPHKIFLRPVHPFTGKLPIIRTAENRVSSQLGSSPRCVFSKSQKSRHHGEGDCKRPLSLLTPLSPKECRVAWAYSIASHWVSFYCAVLSIADNLDHTDGYNTLTITSYLPYCSFFSSCVCMK